MYSYVDLYMPIKPRNLQGVVLNVYGGESLYHPHIVDILTQARQRHHGRTWPLTITTTTNAVVPRRKIRELAPLVDEFTVSWHTEARSSQHDLVRANMLELRDQGIRLKCVILMHPDLFEAAEEHIEWCQQNSIRYLVRQLDNAQSDRRFDYTVSRIHWFQNLYQSRNHQTLTQLSVPGDRVDLAAQGRSCCGGRSLCTNQNLRQRHSFVGNQFRDWYCSVDEFFLFVKQVTGEVFVNKDCKMNFDGSVSPIGYLDRAHELLARTKARLSDPNRMPMRCAKNRCECGLCAPKARNLDIYHEIMEKYHA
jgi:hypothetical protein